MNAAFWVSFIILWIHFGLFESHSYAHVPVNRISFYIFSVRAFCQAFVVLLTVSGQWPFILVCCYYGVQDTVLRVFVVILRVLDISKGHWQATYLSRSQGYVHSFRLILPLSPVFRCQCWQTVTFSLFGNRFVSAYAWTMPIASNWSERSPAT